MRKILLLVRSGLSVCAMANWTPLYLEVLQFELLISADVCGEGQGFLPFLCTQRLMPHD
jgi:hypothetical protein